MNHHRIVWALVLLCLFSGIAVGIFARGFDAPMYYDSEARILEKENLLAKGDIRGFIATIPQRPFVMASFYVNYLIGGMTPAYFRIVNLAFFVATALLVVWVVRLVLDIPGLHDDASSDAKLLVSLFLGLFFLVHPVQIHLTLYIIQRMALFGCFFFLASFGLYLAVRSGKVHNTVLGYAGCIALFVCGITSKENVITLPPILILAEIALFRSGFASVAKRSIVLGGMLVVVFVLLGLIEHPEQDPERGSGILHMIATYYQWTGHTLKTVVLTQCRMLFSYLALGLAPLATTFQLLNPQIISRGLFDPPITALAVAGVVAFVSAGIVLLWKRPLVGFGMLFFVVSLLPESLAVPHYMYFSHRAVLPMVGLLLVVADLVLGVIVAIKSERVRHRVGVAVGIAGLAVLAANAAVTVERAELWNNELAVWKDIVDHFPEQERNVERPARVQALTNYARVLLQAGFPALAIGPLRKAIELDPGDAVAHANLGRALIQVGDYPAAMKHLRIAAKLQPDLWRAHDDMGVVAATTDNLAEAVAHWEKALELNPRAEGVQPNLDRARHLLQREKQGKKPDMKKQPEDQPPAHKDSKGNDS